MKVAEALAETGCAAGDGPETNVVPAALPPIVRGDGVTPFAFTPPVFDTVIVTVICWLKPALGDGVNAMDEDRVAGAATATLFDVAELLVTVFDAYWPMPEALPVKLRVPAAVEAAYVHVKVCDAL